MLAERHVFDGTNGRNSRKKALDTPSKSLSIRILQNVIEQTRKDRNHISDHQFKSLLSSIPWTLLASENDIEKHVGLIANK